MCSRLRIRRAAFEPWIEQSAVRPIERPMAYPPVPPPVPGSLRALLASERRHHMSIERVARHGDPAAVYDVLKSRCIVSA